MRIGAHKADVRIAASNARKIQAALRQGIDGKRVIAAYRLTQPAKSKNPIQDRARARSWAMLNMRINNEPLLEILQSTWADGFALGLAYGDDEIARAREAKKADNPDYVDWDNWKPGDAATATLLRPPKAFQELLGRARVTIKDLDQTGYDRVGTALADSIAQGLSDTRSARLINDAIGNPARALSIAITETNRAMSYGAITRYKAAKLEQMEWATSDPCPACALNSGAVVEIGAAFPSGAEMPPAHPYCRCALLPVIPDFEASENGVVDIAPQEEQFGGVPRSKILAVREKGDKYNSSVTGKGADDLAAAYEEMGYNGLPRVVDVDEFVRLSETADVKVYRGLTAGSNSSVDDFLDQYKYGEHYAGYGVFGNGSYSSTRFQTAASYSQTGNQKSMLTILIPDESNFIAQSDLKSKIKAVLDEISPLFTENKDRWVAEAKRLGLSIDEAEKHPIGLEYFRRRKELSDMQITMSDPGTAATLFGYDGFTVPVDNTNEIYYVILNRSKVVVQK